MANQIGNVRKYTDVEENVSRVTTQCPNCKVRVVPRGITSTGYAKDEQRASVSKQLVESSCPNCGKVLTAWRKI